MKAKEKAGLELSTYWTFDNRIIDIDDDVVETEDGYDLILHFVVESDHTDGCSNCSIIKKYFKKKEKGKHYDFVKEQYCKEIANTTIYGF